ncbi:hypothetical protein TRIUR3_27345 [Triticum urartu]|uniref:Dirigent protein n=1 Tax=Triticum urartu TaxID=4572 RepID=M7YM44_TRIUA|nr:hypothetical protein TRIUR3_27345 [Triticum urartu]
MGAPLFGAVLLCLVLAAAAVPEQQPTLPSSSAANSSTGKVTAREADGSVKFGHGEGSAYLFDPDIYTDGRISVQGIDAVLSPPVEDTAKSAGASPVRKALVVTGTAKPKLRRGNMKKLPTPAVLLIGGDVIHNRRGSVAR